MIEVKSIHLQRGLRSLQTQLSFSVEAGQALWVRGPNGVGKSTLLETLCGFRSLRDDGILNFQGQNISRDWDGFHHALAYCGHKNANAPTLTAFQALGFYADVYGLGRDRVDAALVQSGLANRAEIAVGNLSAGQQRRLALARLVLRECPIWILDEPTVSLDQMGIEWVQSLIRSQLERDGVVIFTSHVNLGIECQELILKPMRRLQTDINDQNWRALL